MSCSKNCVEPYHDSWYHRGRGRRYRDPVIIQQPPVYIQQQQPAVTPQSDVAGIINSPVAILAFFLCLMAFAAFALIIINKNKQQLQMS